MAVVINGTSGITGNTGTLISASTIGVGGATPSASGAGITFPGTPSLSVSSNTLDDYEEGTWTPTLTFSGGTTGIVYDGTYRNGTYVKVGRTVWITCRFGLSNKGSSTGAARITGLPFTPRGGDSGTEIIVGSVWWVNFSNGSNYPFNIRQDATNTGYMEMMGYSTSSESTITNSFFTNSTQVAFTMVYYTIE